MDDLALVDTPSLNEVVHDFSLFVQLLNSAFLGHILQTHDTVRDAAALDKTHKANFSSVVGMGATASFRVNASDVDNAERVARDNTTLVQRETVLSFSFGLVHEAFSDVVTLIDQPVGMVLDLKFFGLSQTLVVSDV